MFDRWWALLDFISLFHYTKKEVFPCATLNSSIENLTVFKLFFEQEIIYMKACNFIKKRLQRRCFPVKFAKFLRTPILKNICERLLLVLITPFFNVSKILWRALCIILEALSKDMKNRRTQFFYGRNTGSFPNFDANIKRI